jgi:ribonuclease R
MARNKKPARHQNEKKHFKRDHKKHHHDHRDGLAPTSVLIITGLDEDGELVAEPQGWNPRKKAPHIVVTESGHAAAVTKGDRVLAKLRKIHPHLYQALVIRVLPADAPQNILGMLVIMADGGIIEPISRKNKESYMVATADLNGAEQGELVAAVSIPGIPSMGMSYAKITERLGSLGSPKAASLIATHMHDLPVAFSKEALKEADEAEPPVLKDGRVDLRDIPLVTIDGEDARDFDDAVFAEEDGNGFHLIVAIADVAHYVKENSALDHDAHKRGNSVYFPDRVIPMLPERLSNGLCSLMPNQDRYCLAVHIWIDGAGNIKKYEFVRGLMRSTARLTYTEVEATQNSANKGLWKAYEALAKNRDERGALDLNLPEYKIIFDASGNVANIAPKARLESMRLIETFMIAANVAAADYLLKHKAHGIYRVHEPPSEEKIDELRNLLKMSGYSLAREVAPKQLNFVLHKSEKDPNQPMIHTAVLRAQMQAYYAAENLGHFGLSLQKYCHFTSPIRRYADLIVHRALAGLIAGKKPVKPEQSLAQAALHISETERKAMMAERDASDRYKVSFMAKRIGDVFQGIIASLNEHGLFVTISGNGVTGFVPIRSLRDDFYLFDKRNACFKGQRSKRIYRLGEQIMIRVEEANAMTGSLIFSPERGDFTPPRNHYSGKPKNKEKHGDNRKHKGRFRGKKR